MSLKLNVALSTVFTEENKYDDNKVEDKDKVEEEEDIKASTFDSQISQMNTYSISSLQVVKLTQEDDN